uniref:9K protein n=1 Tax=Tobacco rattle virus TaxID=12295 RepID=A0A145XVZ0_9VIRU|nr:9K protein [Tobacco rattle virus]
MESGVATRNLSYDKFGSSKIVRWQNDIAGGLEKVVIEFPNLHLIQYVNGAEKKLHTRKLTKFEWTLIGGALYTVDYSWY